MISITAFGRVTPDRMVHRSGAKPGDRIVVTGTIGDAALGLDVLKGGPVAAALAGDAIAREMLAARYRVPQPRNGLANAVRDFASSAMDVSDGLAGDLAKLCKASGVSARVNLADVPLSVPAAALLAQGTVGVEALVAGGDDYEILCTVPEDRLAAFIRMAEAAAIPATSIGVVVGDRAAPRFVDREGRELALQRLSYSHF
jgi:thiamine-monophosphate kinase